MRSCIALLLVAAMAGTARSAEVVVVESYGGARPEDAAQLLAPLHGEFRSLGYQTASADLASRVEARLSRAGGPMSASDLAEANALVDDGFKLYQAGEFAQAIDKLTHGLDSFHRSPATVARDQVLRDGIQRALVGLALSHKRLKQAEEATAAMAELIRSFPDRDFSRSLFGPEAQELYNGVKKDLQAQGRGGLRIDLDDDSAVVFINERYEAVGSIQKTDLLPGRYRVYVQKGTSPGRVRDVDVTVGVTQTLTISWRFDVSLHAAAGFVGFAFAGARERQELEAPYATAFARAVGASGVVVLSIDIYDGRRSLFGSVLSLDSGKPYRMGAIALEPAEPGEDQLRGLARFLAGGKPGPGVFVPGPEGGASKGGGEAVASPGRPYRFWKWLTFGAGLAAVGAGVTLVVVHVPEYDDTGGRRDDAFPSRTPGIITAAGGIALLGTSAIFFALDARSPRSARDTRVSVAPSEAGGWLVTVGGRF